MQHCKSNCVNACVACHTCIKASQPTKAAESALADVCLHLIAADLHVKKLTTSTSPPGEAVNPRTCTKLKILTAV